MSATIIEHHATLWMRDDVPERMVYAGHRWRVTDVPTRLRWPVWSVAPGDHGLYGWRFQAADEDGRVIVFDIYRGEDAWHVHHTWA